MKPDPLVVACIICAALAIVLFSLLAFEHSFPVFSGDQTSNLVDITADVGGEDSRFLWTNTGLALIAQAFVLFAAAAATLGLLKVNEEKQHA
ncbi:MAG: hypothetical protein ACM3UY_05525 [Methanocella sp.]|jgi:hypothetical protein